MFLGCACEQATRRGWTLLNSFDHTFGSGWPRMQRLPNPALLPSERSRVKTRTFKKRWRRAAVLPKSSPDFFAGKQVSLGAQKDFLCAHINIKQVTVTSLHPPRVCRVAVILSKPQRSLNIDGRPLPTKKRWRTSSKACAPHIFHAPPTSFNRRLTALCIVDSNITVQ